MKDSTRGPAAKLHTNPRFVVTVGGDIKELSCLTMLLEWFNYKVISFKTASEVLEIAAVVLPSAIITSLNLPDMKGFSLMEKLKQNAATRQIPFIVLMKTNDQILKRNCLEKGALGLLCQPLDIETLYRALQTAMKNPRTGMRIRTRQPVLVFSDLAKGGYNTDTLDLSPKGMFIRSTFPDTVLSKIKLELNLEGKPIKSEGLVVYNCNAEEGPHGHPGMGIKFTHITPGDQEFIRHFTTLEVIRNVALSGSCTHSIY